MNMLSQYSNRLNSNMSFDDEVVEINVGGKLFATTQTTLKKSPSNLISELYEKGGYVKDKNGNLFIDHNPRYFEYVIDFMRIGKTSVFDKPDSYSKLIEEAEFFRLEKMKEAICQLRSQQCISYSIPSTITIGYRGTFYNGREGVNDLRFRKLGRLLVAGQTNACREVFGLQLNDTREPDIGNEYSSRFYLQNSNLEHAFDLLYKAGYKLVTSSASGTCNCSSSADSKAMSNCEEARWQHYNEFVFTKE